MVLERVLKKLFNTQMYHNSWAKCLGALHRSPKYSDDTGESKAGSSMSQLKLLLEEVLSVLLCNSACSKCPILSVAVFSTRFVIPPVYRGSWGVLFALLVVSANHLTPHVNVKGVAVDVIQTGE